MGVAVVVISASSGKIGTHAGRRVGATGVEDPADVIVEDVVVGFRIQRIDLGSASKNCQLKNKNKIFVNYKVDFLNFNQARMDGILLFLLA